MIAIPSSIGRSVNHEEVYDRKISQFRPQVWASCSPFGKLCVPTAFLFNRPNQVELSLTTLGLFNDVAGAETCLAGIVPTGHSSPAEKRCQLHSLLLLRRRSPTLSGSPFPTGNWSSPATAVGMASEVADAEPRTPQMPPQRISWSARAGGRLAAINRRGLKHYG